MTRAALRALMITAGAAVAVWSALQFRVADWPIYVVYALLSVLLFRFYIEVLPTLVLPEVTTLPLDSFLEGVELYRRGDALKVVFTP